MLMQAQQQLAEGLTLNPKRCVAGARLYKFVRCRFILLTVLRARIMIVLCLVFLINSLSPLSREAMERLEVL